MSLDAALGPEWAALSMATAADTTAALSRDQSAALAPAEPAATPFASAQDAVARLLPYHVFQAPLPEPVDELDKHSEYHSTALWSRFSALQKRHRRALVADDGGHTRAQRASSMLLHLDHLAAENERSLLSGEITSLTRTRSEYEQWTQVNPRLRATMPNSTSLTQLKTTTVPSILAPTSAPSTASSLPAAPTAASSSSATAPMWPKAPSKKRGRKSKTELAAAAAAATAGMAKSPSPAGVTSTANTSGPASRPQFPTPGTGMPQGVPMGFPGIIMPSFSGIGTGAPSASATSPAPTGAEKTVPFILQIPLTWLTRLTQAGIHPLPAPHLVPALSTGTQAGVRVGSETAPRPPAPDQKEAAVLVGMTQVVPPTSPSSPPVQILHVSVRWDKLTSQQLTTVVNMITSIQQAHATPAGTAAGASTAGSPPAGGMMMPPRVGFQGPLLPLGVMPGFPFAPSAGNSPATGVSPAGSPAGISPLPQPAPRGKATSPSPSQPSQ